MRRGILALSLMLLGSVGLATILPQTASAQVQDCDRAGMILTLKPWYYGLTEGTHPNCTIRSPGSTTDEQSKFVWTIGINIVDDLLQVVAYIALGFILYGGFVFITSTGAPEKAAAGRKLIIHAVVGLVVAMAAVLLVNLVARRALGI